MIAKIHAKGKSFAGIGRYVLHDKDRAETSERVGFTETRNIAIDDPQLATRIMAATALDQHRLKAEAGVSTKGRRSNDTVLHVTLSWHPDEAESLLPEEQRRAAYAAINALGAADRQALIVSHTDEDQPHVHLVINRVSPEDGRMLSSSKDRIKLSKWAQSYEEERGQILCDERVVNNAARDRGEFVKAEKDDPRHVYEEQVANDNAKDLDSRRRAAALRTAQRNKDREVGRAQRVGRAARRAELRKLEAGYLEGKGELRADLEQRIGTARNRIRDAMRDQWRQRHHERRAELAAFEKNEGTLTGRMKNRMGGIDWKAMVIGDQKARTIGEAFGGLASRGARLERATKQQDKLDRALKAEQTRREQQAGRLERQQQAAKLAKLREQFIADRAGMRVRHASAEAKERRAWQTRARERTAAWIKHREATKGRDIRDIARQVRERSKASNPQSSTGSQSGRRAPQSDENARKGLSAAQEALRRHKTRRAAQKQRGHDEKDMD
jgi:hypothetical protein